MGWWGRVTETLSDLIQGRHRMLPIFRTMQSVYLARAYYLAAELNLADRLRQQPMTVLQLAEATGVQTAMLSRVLRVLAAFKVIREDRQGAFHLRPRGRPLLSDAPASLHQWLLFIGRPEVWQGFAMAMESLRTGKSGFELAHGRQLLRLPSSASRAARGLRLQHEQVDRLASPAHREGV